LNLLTKLVFTRKPFFVVAKPEREPMIRDAINSNGPANIRFVRVSYLRRTPGHFEMHKRRHSRGDIGTTSHVSSERHMRVSQVH
jgi:hypothetical protein